MIGGGFSGRLRAVAGRVIRHLGAGETLTFQRAAETWTLPRLKTGDVAAPADRGMLPRGFAFLVSPVESLPAPERGDLLTEYGVTVTSVETIGGGDQPAYFRVLAGEATA